MQVVCSKIQQSTKHILFFFATAPDFDDLALTRIPKEDTHTHKFQARETPCHPVIHARRASPDFTSKNTDSMLRRPDHFFWFPCSKTYKDNPCFVHVLHISLSPSLTLQAIAPRELAVLSAMRLDAGSSVHRAVLGFLKRRGLFGCFTCVVGSL